MGAADLARLGSAAEYGRQAAVEVRKQLLYLIANGRAPHRSTQFIDRLIKLPACLGANVVPATSRIPILFDAHPWLL